MKLKYYCIVLVRDHPEQNGSSEPWLVVKATKRDGPLQETA